MADALIEAGADLNFQKDGKGDTPLIGAASLGAEDVGIRLLDAGANPLLRGLFGETALHWAAMLGKDHLRSVSRAHNHRWGIANEAPCPPAGLIA